MSLIIATTINVAVKTRTCSSSLFTFQYTYRFKLMNCEVQGNQFSNYMARYQDENLFSFMIALCVINEPNHVFQHETNIIQDVVMRAIPNAFGAQISV